MILWSPKNSSKSTWTSVDIKKSNIVPPPQKNKQTKNPKIPNKQTNKNSVEIWACTGYKLAYKITLHFLEGSFSQIHILNIQSNHLKFLVVICVRPASPGYYI